MEARGQELKPPSWIREDGSVGEAASLSRGQFLERDPEL